MRIFEIVKENVNLREAAELYGIDVNRYGKALCPFHNDRNPSLYVADDHYYCFACGEHGDVIDFVGKLFQLSPYLEMHRPILFNELVLSDKLFEHCAEIEEAARNRMELIVRSLAEQNGVTEQLKADNQMEWVRQMNACKAQAEEIVKAELIYD